MSVEPDAAAAPDPGSRLRLAAAFGISGIAFWRATVMQAERRWFDVDPWEFPSPLPAMGMFGSLVLDVLLFVFVAIAAVGIARGGARVAGVRAWAWLALVPGAVVLAWHGQSDATDQWMGWSWIAAVAAGGAAYAMAADRRVRAVLVAMLLATLAAGLTRGAMQVEVGPWVGPEHAQTLEEWRTSKQEFLAERGWAADSPAARIFERRMRQPQPRGWFATTNVLGTLAAFGVVFSAALAVAAARARLGGGSIAVLVVLAGASTGALLLSGSKGAIAAAGLGAVVLGLGLLVVRAGDRGPRPALERGLAILGLAVLPGVIGLVMARGAISEDFAGDRSLLFRWHYLSAAIDAFAEAPLAGHGAAGFDDAYLRHRPERSPEEVTSAHNVAADWLVSGGLAVAPWVLAVMLAVGAAAGAVPRAGTDAGDRAAPDPGKSGDPENRGLALSTAGVVAAVACAASIGPGAADLGVRLAGGAAGAVVAVIVVDLLARRGRGIEGPLAAGCAAGAVVLAAHGAIEMTATQPGAACWWCVAIGLVAGAIRPARSNSGPSANGTSIPAAGAAVGASALAAILLVTGVRPAFARSTAVERAAATLTGSSNTAAIRDAAAGRLAEAEAIEPAAEWIVVERIEQRLAAIVMQRDPEIARAWAEAFARDAAMYAEPGVAGPAVLASVIQGLEVVADLRLAAAGDLPVTLAELRVESDPAGVGARRQLAEALLSAERVDEAAAAARRTLELDDAKELDPAKQLPARSRRDLEAIIALGAGAGAGSTETP